jgi:PAS domain S-box-containing protein
MARKNKRPMNEISKDVLETLTEMIIRHRKDSTVVYANNAFMSAFGLNPEELIGKKWFDIAPDQHTSSVKSLMEQVTPQNPVKEYVQSFEVGKGIVKWIAWVSKGIFDESGEMVEFQVVGRDITEQKENEIRLKELLVRVRETEELFHTMIDYTRDIESWYSNEGHLIYISPACLDITGYTQEEFMQGKVKEEDLFTPEYRSLWNLHFDRLKAGGATSVDFDLLVKHKEGHNKWLNVRGSIMVSDGGEERGYRFSSRDITDKKDISIELDNALRDIVVLNSRLEDINKYLRDKSAENTDVGFFLVGSPAMTEVIEDALSKSTSSLPVLITGESGSGKKWLAEYLHHHSQRSKQTLININCRSFYPSELRKELFGYAERDVVQGEMRLIPGRIALAAHSSLVVEEISSMPLDIQQELFGFLQKGRYSPVGSSEIVESEVWIIATVTEDPVLMVDAGLFYEPLYQMLTATKINIPPLRERLEDLSELTWGIIDSIAQETGKRIEHITPESLSLLRRYHWPGNITELRNVLEYSIGQSTDSVLTLLMPESTSAETLLVTIDEVQRRHILRVLEATHGRI